MANYEKKIEIARSLVDSENNMIIIEPAATKPYFLTMAIGPKIGYDHDIIYLKPTKEIFIEDINSGEIICSGRTNATEKQIKYEIRLAQIYEHTGSEPPYNQNTLYAEKLGTDFSFRKRIFPQIGKKDYQDLTRKILKYTTWFEKRGKYEKYIFSRNPEIKSGKIILSENKFEALENAHEPIITLDDF